MTTQIFSLLSDFKILAEVGSPPTEAIPPPGLVDFLPLILLFVGIWFLLIAPQRRYQKKHRALLNALSSGDRVLTRGGLYATIKEVQDEVLVVDLGNNTLAKIAKSFVGNKVDQSDVPTTQ